MATPETLSVPEGQTQNPQTSPDQTSPDEGNKLLAGMQAEALGNQEELKDQNAILIAIDHVNKMLEEGGRPPKKFSAMAYRKGTPEFNEAMKFMKGSQDTGPDFKEEDVTRIVVLKYAETDKSGKTVVEGIDVALNDELEVKGTAD